MLGVVSIAVIAGRALSMDALGGGGIIVFWGTARPFDLSGATGGLLGKEGLCSPVSCGEM